MPILGEGSGKEGSRQMVSPSLLLHSKPPTRRRLPTFLWNNLCNPQHLSRQQLKLKLPLRTLQQANELRLMRKMIHFIQIHNCTRDWIIWLPHLPSPRDGWWPTNSSCKQKKKRVLHVEQRRLPKRKPLGGLKNRTVRSHSATYML